MGVPGLVSLILYRHGGASKGGDWTDVQTFRICRSKGFEGFFRCSLFNPMPPSSSSRTTKLAPFVGSWFHGNLLICVQPGESYVDTTMTRPSMIASSGSTPTIATNVHNHLLLVQPSPMFWVPLTVSGQRSMLHLAAGIADQGCIWF